MPATLQDLLALARHHVTIINDQQAEIMLQNQCAVLDVREPGEFQQGHLPDAVNIPRGILEFKIADHPAIDDFNTPVLIYCKNGGRSTFAAATLKEMGYQQVKMLDGGFDSWQGHVHKIEKEIGAY
ncbi:rhodanese-like domain-containing protein [Pelagibaculum spongiae]|uniref:Sulfurtransferase n=1 Tax=Pelagibaculum spongiae TaxID=2080658 RepID=A0A2V1GRC0_9GAMM|nr:rhodanese-like domain-containing protein [Pelagibaculum spongiae]PVZ67628.1 sulfurtransferase [Pelagibaculum spongiae]